MAILANVIIPAVYTYYGSLIFFPVIAVGVVFVDAATLRIWNKDIGMCAIFVPTLANIISALVGLILFYSLPLPSGWVENNKELLVHGPFFGPIATAGFLGAFALSVGIEGWITKAFSKELGIQTYGCR